LKEPRNDKFDRINSLLTFSIQLITKYVTILRVITLATLIQDVFEAFSISETSDWFIYLEDNIGAISYVIQHENKDRHLQTRGFLLKSFMLFMKRLSKSNDVILCGRILIYLSKLMPLFDVSGDNRKGKINTAHVTFFNPDGNPGSEVEKNDKQLYKTFWKLITYLQDFTLVQKTESDWTFVIDAVNTVIDIFGTNSDCTIAPVSSNACFTTKHLTSPQLLMLEFAEPYFREHIMIQMLIFFQALKLSSTKTDNNLPEAKKEVILEIERKIKNTISIFGVKNESNQLKRIGSTIEHVINRENNWIQWKKQQCFDFGKPKDIPVEQDVSIISPPKKKIKYGNKHLASVFEMASELHPESATRLPDVNHFFAPVIREIDFEDDLKIINKQVFQWKAVRLLCRSNYNCISDLIPADVSLKDGVTNLQKEPAKQIPIWKPEIEKVAKQLLQTNDNADLSPTKSESKKRKRSISEQNESSIAIL